jgi:hypothetical protein
MNSATVRLRSARDFDHGPNEVLLHLTLKQVPYEASVDLQISHRQILEVVEGREADAEVEP